MAIPVNIDDLINKRIEKYQIRAKIYRNRRIGNFLKELKLIEGRNTGFPNAIKALRENGSDLPKFDMNTQRDYLSVIIPVHNYFVPKSKTTDKKQAYKEKIINVLKNKPLSLTELSNAMGYKGITSKLRQSVQELIADGRIEKIADEGYGTKLNVAK